MSTVLQVTFWTNSFVVLPSMICFDIDACVWSRILSLPTDAQPAPTSNAPMTTTNKVALFMFRHLPFLHLDAEAGLRPMAAASNDGGRIGLKAASLSIDLALSKPPASRQTASFLRLWQPQHIRCVARVPATITPLQISGYSPRLAFSEKSLCDPSRD